MTKKIPIQGAMRGANSKSDTLEASTYFGRADHFWGALHGEIEDHGAK